VGIRFPDEIIGENGEKIEGIKCYK